MSARLFDAIILIDWSAASRPVTGPDSVWIGIMKRDVRFRWTFEAHNPSTRAEAEKLVEAELAERRKRGERVLLGVDFPLGFPRGTAAALQLQTEPAWRAVWTQILGMVKDKPDNTNNRFAVGASLNRKMTGEAFPFWGCPATEAQTSLSVKRPRAHGAADVPEFRLTEEAAKGAQSVWKLFYNGSVGGQALVGLPVVKRWRDAPQRAERARIWPFETGLRALGTAELEAIDLVIVEIYPALVKELRPEAKPGEVKDLAQIRALAEYLSALDEAGRLSPLFAGVKPLAADERVKVEQEEGWILGA